MSDPSRPALVTGASRGFGRAIATALVAAGLPVVGIARDMHKKNDLLASPPQRLGGPGRGGPGRGRG